MQDFYCWYCDASNTRAAALALGYRVMHVSPRHVRNGQAVSWIEAVLKQQEQEKTR